MANWYGTSRSNYFRVKDIAAFKAALENNPGVDLWDGDGDLAGTVALGDGTGEGWPSEYFDAEDNLVEFDIADLIAKHLADGEVCVLMTSGAEKLRYVTGRACAFTNKPGEFVVIDIDDIYNLAQVRFGIRPTTACY